MKFNTERTLRRQLKRRSAQLQRHVEVLGAAFMRETGLDPRQTVVVTRQTDDGHVEQYFQSRAKDERLEALLEVCRATAEGGDTAMAAALQAFVGEDRG